MTQCFVNWNIVIVSNTHHDSVNGERVNTIYLQLKPASFSTNVVSFKLRQLSFPSTTFLLAYKVGDFMLAKQVECRNLAV